MEIQELKKATTDGLMQVNALLKQLFYDPATYAPISLPIWQQIVKDEKIIIVAAQEKEQIIGIGLLYVILKPRGKYGYLEDMMVDEQYRGQGIGEQIGRALIESAKARGVGTIELSARPSRVAANKLYQKLGFEHKDTNVYRLKL